jgi:hypothetical protein
MTTTSPPLVGATSSISMRSRLRCALHRGPVHRRTRGDSPSPLFYPTIADVAEDLVIRRSA